MTKHRVCHLTTPFSNGDNDIERIAMRFLIASAALLLPGATCAQTSQVSTERCLREVGTCQLVKVSEEIQVGRSHGGTGTGVFAIGMQNSPAGSVPGLTDLSMPSPFTFSKSMVIPSNESALYASAYLHPTAAVNYQKNALYVTLQHADPSIYTSRGSGTGAATVTSAKDGVGLDVQVGLVPGNMTGRLFGIDNITTYPRGADGSGTGAEFKIVNDASDQPYFSTSTSKHGLNLFAAGNYDTTTAIWADSANDGRARFHTVVFATAQGVRDNFLELRQTSQSTAGSLFKVSAAGDITTRGVIDLAERQASTVGTPPPGYQRIFIDAADHKMKRKDHTGKVVTMN